MGAPVHRELYAGPGRHRFAVAPGPYTVTLSRGFEYEIVRAEVSLQPGGGEIVREELERSVDSNGWVATTVHVHSELSVDSDLPIDLRMYSLAAAGMEYIFPTEHDVFSDYTPYISDFGLGAWLKSDVGSEISPIMGHFNCLGCRHDPREFAVPWVETDEDGNFVRALEAPEIWQNLRDNFDAQVIQINHPFTTQAFMYSIGFDIKQPFESLVGERFNTEFDTFEIYNSHDDRDELYYETLPGWYWMLNQGVRKTGVGAEDTHSARGTGTPRTLVAATDGDPAAVDAKEIAQGLVVGRAITCQGPLPELWVDGTPIGGDVSPVGGKVSIRMKVQAPTWMSLGSARLIRNGDVVWEKDLKTPENTAIVNALRMDETIERTETGPAWYALLVEGDDYRMAPVYSGDAPFAITNPVYVSAE